MKEKTKIIIVMLSIFLLGCLPITGIVTFETQEYNISIHNDFNEEYFISLFMDKKLLFENRTILPYSTLNYSQYLPMFCYEATGNSIYSITTSTGKAYLVDMTASVSIAIKP